MNATTPIIGTLLPHLSWQRESTFKLSNGWIAGVSWSDSYQREFVKGLSKGPFCWRACDGISGLPDFAKDWLLRESTCSSLQNVVAVGFTKKYDNTTDTDSHRGYSYPDVFENPSRGRGTPALEMTGSCA